MVWFEEETHITLKIIEYINPLVQTLGFMFWFAFDFVLFIDCLFCFVSFFPPSLCTYRERRRTDVRSCLQLPALPLAGQHAEPSRHGGHESGGHWHSGKNTLCGCVCFFGKKKNFSTYILFLKTLLGRRKKSTSKCTATESRSPTCFRFDVRLAFFFNHCSAFYLGLSF